MRCKRIKKLVNVNHLKHLTLTIKFFNNYFQIQENIITIEHTMQTWKNDPLFMRTDDGRSEPLFNIKGTAIEIFKRVRVRAQNGPFSGIPSFI